MRKLHEPTIFLVRHGRTEFNQGSDEKSRLKGTTFDLPLTAEGQREADRAGQYIAQFDVASIKHSPMLRAKQTADRIASATGHGMDEVKWLDPWDVGYLAGHTRAAGQDRLEYYIRNPHKTVPEGQAYGPWFDVFTHGLEREMRAAERSHSSPEYKAHVLVTHSCNAAATISAIRGGEPEFHSETGEAPGNIIRLSKNGGRWQARDVDLEGREADLA